MYASDFRQYAHQKTAPYASRLAVICLIFAAISMALGLPYLKFETEYIYGYDIIVFPLASISTIGSLILSGPLQMSNVLIASKVYDGYEPKYNDICFGFKKFKQAFLINLLEGIYIVLWALIPLVGPFIAISKGFAYSMAYYISLDNDRLSPNECIGSSVQLMQGNKWRLFCLMFSYIGWIILCALTAGILYFWVKPRMDVAVCAFYRELVGEGQIQ